MTTSEIQSTLYSPVYVIGVGMTKFVSPGDVKQDYQLFVKQAVNDALKDAGLDFSHVEQACVGYVYGESGCGQKALHEIGVTGIPIHNVNNNCATGATALFLAKKLIESKACDCTLAVGFEVMEKGVLTSKFRDRTHPMDKHIEFLSKKYGIKPAPITAQLFGAAAREHMEKYHSTAEHFAKIAWKNHKHSINNPYSLQQTEYSLDDILASKETFHPITKLQCCPVANGAAAAILASKEFVYKNGLQNQAVEILAMELATDLPTTFSEQSCIKLVGFDMTKKAAKTAFKKAGIQPMDIDVIELHDCFSTNELITYEALGLCDVGKGAELVESGNNTYGGKFVVNPSGGLISKGHPLGATGVAQCVELTWQLRQEAGKRQVSGAKLALQHNIGLGGAVVVAVYKKALESTEKCEKSKSDGFFRTLKNKIRRPAEISNLTGNIRFNVNNQEGKSQVWSVLMEKGECTVLEGTIEAPNCIITASDDLLMNIFDLHQLLMNKDVKIKGDTDFFLKLIPNSHLMGKL